MEDKVLSGPEVSFQLVLHAGNSRNYSIEALRCLMANDAEGAEENMKLAEDELTASHALEAQLLQRYAGGEKVDMDIFLVHANDHLTMAIMMQELVNELRPLIEKVSSI